MTDPLLFSLAVRAVLAVPGPTNTLLMTSGATVGVRLVRVRWARMAVPDNQDLMKAIGLEQ